MIEEFYLESLAELEALKSQPLTDQTEDIRDRIADLEALMAGREDRVSWAELSEEEAEDQWSVAQATRDPLGQYWEYRIAKGLPLDLEITEAPPREDWDNVDGPIDQNQSG